VNPSGADQTLQNLTAKFEKLVAANIRLLPLNGIANHFVFERDGFAALVERTPEGFGQIGSSGVLVDQGFAVLVRRGEKSFFVAKGFERPADPPEVDRLRQFSSDLENALR
jgi:hypothetical protein